jgi:hypothetical protein
MVRAIRKNRIITDGSDFYKIISEAYTENDCGIFKINLKKEGTDTIIKMPCQFLLDLLNTRRRFLLPPNAGLTVNAMRLIPLSQLEATLSSKELMETHKERLNALAGNIPKLYETDGLKDIKYPLHYFFYNTDYYVKEYDGKDEFFGFMILNGDIEMAELGYQYRSILFSSMPSISLDYYYKPLTLDEIKKKHKI